MKAPSTRNPNYALLIYAAGFFTLIAVGVNLIGQIPTTRDRWLIGALFVVFGALLAVSVPTRGRPLLTHLVLAAETSVILLVLFVEPSLETFNVIVLFFVMSGQTVLLLSNLESALWIALFGAIIMGFSAFYGGAGMVVENLDALGGLIFFAVFGHVLREVDSARARGQQLLEELQDAHRQLQQYAAQAEELAVAEERNRLAREMHDTLGHRLTVAVLNLEGAQRLIPSAPGRAASMVATMRDELRAALADLRGVVSTLRTPLEEESALPTAVRALAERFQTAANINLHLTLDPDLPPLPPPYRLALYRAGQECLTNVQRHAGADAVWLAVGQRNGAIELSVADNGRGLGDPGAALAQPARFGLRGLRERAGALGGDLTLAERPGGGTAVTLRLPWPVPGAAP